MRVLVAANLTPFLKGGADDHIQNLSQALIQTGHQVETLRLPFAFNPAADIGRAMQAARALDLQARSGQSIDRLISLQFPAYGVQHPHHVAWVMHQHRAVYELFDSAKTPKAEQALRPAIHQFDAEVLGPISHKAGFLPTQSVWQSDCSNSINSMPSRFTTRRRITSVFTQTKRRTTFFFQADLSP